MDIKIIRDWKCTSCGNLIQLTIDDLFCGNCDTEAKLRDIFLQKDLAFNNNFQQWGRVKRI